MRTVSRAGSVPGLRSTTDLPDGSYARAVDGVSGRVGFGDTVAGAW